ncbi:T6SS phospholipase effector Tle1-like catalytic domain-containing protein [Paraburkholderia sp. BCC1885]|uniref:T6SS phospholipase effector Tle1-like catalytic domain-containing protein n=1 Tax=Paraburkholderia sp. BCC1885 TaxID=2562669 RepID=UPI0011820258|nr:DUF2235 domain-containing protein [Paraburkholderia sp. BCC1885]
MSVISWPDAINEQGRLSESSNARARGISALNDGPPGCPQVLHVNLFFDGTNNNMNWDVRNADAPTHTNLARLFRACPLDMSRGVYPYYIPGVGTPFPEIGEMEFTSLGKAVAYGFGMRVAWGYTRLINALYQAMVGPPLMQDPDARELCAAMDDEMVASNGTLAHLAREASAVPPVALPANGVQRGAKYYYGHRSQTILTRLHNELSAVQKKNSAPGGQLNRSIRQVWVNVFGFSRGAAAARVFVSRLINSWAQGGMIAGAIPYKVNFLGLFDTVASVGIPDTATATLSVNDLDGHWMWCAKGALDVPASVKKCVHFFSIHEQRMSFPLDAIREGNQYPGGEARRIEVAYPGVHSDVGGGYAKGEEGKSREKGVGEGDKLSQVPLHNMYIEALKAGVPLMVQSEISRRDDLVKDFALSPTVARAFNDWLSTVSSVSLKPEDGVETALRTGMAQSLAWRTLRADIGNPQNYVTAQPFFESAREDKYTPYGLETQLASKAAASSQVGVLQKEKAALQARKVAAEAAALSVAAIPALANPFAVQAAKLGDQIKLKDKAILEATAGPGKHSRPGEGPLDIMTNDKTDLLEAAEEFRLLLSYLRPQQRTLRQVSWSVPVAASVKPFAGAPSVSIEQNAHAYYLTVDRKGVAQHARQGSKSVWMGGRDRVIQLLGAVAPYQPVLDFVLTPPPQMVPFLLEHTSNEAIQKLAPAAIRLLDDYVHDSRAWFRAPYFHEYVPGGYGWARTFFVGKDTRVRHSGLKDNFASIVAQRDGQEEADLGAFIASGWSTLNDSLNITPPVRVDFNSLPQL